MKVQKMMIMEAFKDMENALKVLLSPVPVWISLFKECFPAATAAQFVTLVRTRGLGERRERELDVQFSGQPG
jgi:hypothetical protein